MSVKYDVQQKRRGAVCQFEDTERELEVDEAFNLLSDNCDKDSRTRLPYFSVRGDPGTSEETRETALEIIAQFLHKDLAYGAQIMDYSQAKELAQSFCDTIENVWGQRNNVTYYSACAATEHTFDKGVLAISAHKVALIWVWDED